MALLSPRQTRQAVLIGLIVYAAVMAGIGGWIAFYSEDTLQDRVSRTRSVSISLGKKTPPVPGSWTDSMPQDEFPEEQPAALPDQEALPVLPGKDDAQTPAGNVEPQADMPLPETPVTSSSEEPKEVEKETPAVETASVSAAQPHWMKYARQFDTTDTRPRIALVVTDLGFASTATSAAIQDLPGEVTLGFSSVAPDIETWIAKARAAGHEVVLTVPMEPDNYPRNDPGPNTLLVGLPDKENVTRMEWALSRATGYVGVMPAMGERFVTLEDKLTPVVDVVAQHGLTVLDSTRQSNSVLAPVARMARIPFARGDVLIDASASRDAIDVQLAQLEKLARENGQAVGIALPYPVTFEKLKAWIATLEEKGIILAPVTAVLRN